MTGVPRVLFVSGSASGNTLRYRVRYAEELLRATGVETAAIHFTDPQAVAWAQDADAVVLYRTPASRRIFRLVEHVRTRLRRPLAFDVDDLVFLPEHVQHIPFLQDLPEKRRAVFTDDARRRGRIVPFVDAVTGSTGPVIADLGRLTGAPATVLPNGVPPTALRLADGVRRESAPGVVRVGYFSGSATHDEDWAVVEPAVVDLLRRDPRVELWLVGPLRPSPGLEQVEDRVVRIPSVPWQQLPALLASVDVNVAPLDLTPFTEGKSAIKWLEAALVRTPTIATATQPFVDATVNGDDVLLVPGGGDWAEPLARLVDDADLRVALGERARTAALERFGPDAQAQRYRGWLDGLLAAGPVEVDLAELRRRRDEEGRSATLGIPLEPYAFPAVDAGRTWAAPRGAEALDRFRTASRTSGRYAVRYYKGARRRVNRVLGTGPAVTRAADGPAPPGSGRPDGRSKT